MQISREQIASGAVFCRLKIRALSFSFRLCEKKRGKKALLFNCAVANSIHRPMFLLAFVISLAVSISQIKKSSRFSRLFSKPVSNRYSLDRFIDSFEFLNNKEYPQIIFRTRSTLGALFKRWNRYGLFTPMRGTFILSEKWIIRRLFDASKLEITVLHPLVTSKRFLFVIVLYIYIFSWRFHVLVTPCRAMLRGALRKKLAASDWKSRLYRGYPPNPWIINQSERSRRALPHPFVLENYIIRKTFSFRGINYFC